MKEKVDYQFIAVPYKAAYACDALCLAVLIILIQKENYWKDKGRLDSNGFFYTANAEIESRIGYKRNVVNETIEGLFRGNMIDIIPSSSKKESNKYRINWNTILAYDKLSLEELNHPAMRIHKVTLYIKILIIMIVLIALLHLIVICLNLQEKKLVTTVKMRF